MQKYLIVIEKAESNYSAFSPDLPGCITVGHTIEGTASNMKEAIELYLEASSEPPPATQGLGHHLDNDIFSEYEIVGEYVIGIIKETTW